MMRLLVRARTDSTKGGPSSSLHRGDAPPLLREAGKVDARSAAGWGTESKDGSMQVRGDRGAIRQRRGGWPHPIRPPDLSPGAASNDGRLSTPYGPPNDGRLSTPYGATPWSSQGAGSCPAELGKEGAAAAGRPDFRRPACGAGALPNKFTRP